MVKQYCDRCGKECECLFKISVPVSKDRDQYGYFHQKSFDVCKSCENEHDALTDKLAEIRCVLFNDFMKVGDE